MLSADTEITAHAVNKAPTDTGSDVNACIKHAAPERSCLHSVNINADYTIWCICSRKTLRTVMCDVDTVWLYLGDQKGSLRRRKHLAMKLYRSSNHRWRTLLLHRWTHTHTHTRIWQLIWAFLKHTFIQKNFVFHFFFEVQSLIISQTYKKARMLLWQSLISSWVYHPAARQTLASPSWTAGGNGSS